MLRSIDTVGDACGKGIHKAVAVISRIKPELTAHRGHAKAVAISANALNYPMHKLPGFWVIRRAKAE